MNSRIPALAAMVLLAIGQCSLAADPLAKRDDSASEKLGMKLSLQCWTFNKLTFFETVDKAKGLGIKYLEIYPGQKLKPGADVVVNKDMSDDTIAEIKKKLADAGGLKLVAYGVDGIATDEKGARKEFEWAKKMGLEVIVTETTPNDTLDKLAKEFKIRVALHNHPWSWPPDKVLKETKDLSKMVGSCSDTGHWMRAKYIPVDTLKKLEGRVEHLHFKDLNDFGGDAHDVPWGTGKGDVKGMLTELKRQGYKGYLSIEYEFGDIKHLDENLPKCVEFFDKTLGELAKGVAPPDVKVELRRAERRPAEGLTEATVGGTTDKVYLYKEVELSNEDISDAKVMLDDDKIPLIEVVFTKAGQKKMAKLTKDHKDKPLAILVDGKVICAPNVYAEVSEKAHIVGYFTKEEAERIAKGLKGK